MSGLEAVVELAKAFAWPVAVVVAVILLRADIGKAIARARRVTYGKATAELGEAEAPADLTRAAAETADLRRLRPLLRGGGGIETRGGSPGDMMHSPQLDLRAVEEDERRRVEQLIRGGFAWGWNSRDVFQPGPAPEVVIRWKDRGEEPVTFLQRTPTQDKGD